MSSPSTRRPGASPRVPTAAPDFSCAIAPNGFLARAGSAFQELTGRTAETLTSRPLAEFVHEADRGTLAAALDWKDPEGEPLLFEVRFRHADGSYRWLEWTVTGRPGDEVRRASVRDVTRWKRDEALALAHARALEAIVAEQPLPEVLAQVAGLLEAIGLDFVAMVHAASGDGQALELAWGPALPEPLRRAVERLLLAGGPGAAVAAVAERKMVATPDLALETHWRGRRELPLAHGLRAEWAQPVLDAAGSPRGAVTVFLTQPALPAPRDRQILALAAQVVGTALERAALRHGAGLAEQRRADEQRATAERHAAEVAALETRLAEATAALEVARAELGNVARTVERAQAEAREALQARLAVEASLEAARGAAAAEAARREEADARVEAAERRAAERAAALEAQVADLEARTAVAEAAVTVREEEVEAERRGREEAEAALARARQEAAEALAWAHEEAEAVEAEHAREREAAAAERGALAEEAARVASAREALTAEVGAVRARLVDAEALLREMEAGHEALRAELARVRDETDGRHGALAAERDEARGALDAARRELEAARRERDDAREARLVVQRELEALRAEAGALAAVLAATRDALGEAERHAGAGDAAARAELEAALAHLQRDAGAYRAWAEAELNMLGLRVAEFDASRAALEGALRAEAEALRERAEAEARRRAEVEGALRDGNRALEELTPLRAQLAMAERRIVELEVALEEARERPPAAPASSDVDEDLAALHARLAESDAARQRLEAALAEARREAEDVRRALDFERARCTEENDRLSAQLAAAEGARAALAAAAEPREAPAAAAGDAEGYGEPLDLSALVERLRGELAAMLPADVQLHVRLTPHLPPVAGDAGALRQVLAQLVSNAAEALEGRRGVVSVATGVVDADRPYLKSAYFDDGLPEGRYAFLEVSDTGHGMPPEVQRRLFDPGFSTRAPGRGLGLPLALAAVRAHQGAIQVYTKPDVGTTLRVLLPIAALVRRRRAEEGAGADGTPRAATAVLVLDRDATMRAAAARILERWGFTVLEASGYEEGASLLRDAEAVRLVLLEAGLKGPEGPATTALRALRDDLRVLLAGEPNGTGNGTGAAAVVARPFAPVELVAAVRAALGAGGA